ncbi:MAG: hypothetical protein ACETWG_03705 [Candidatus Neomarinimicrobiota bacterium]
MANLKPPAAVLVGLLMIGCGGIFDTTGQEDLVATEVHLQQGFEQHWVSVEVDGNVRFKAFLDSNAPLVGPLALFSLDLPRGHHRLVIRWVPTDGNRQAYMHSTDFTLGKGDTCYLRLTVSNNILDMLVQESPFAYV